MPVIKSAIKKLRQARKKNASNVAIRRGVKELLDAFKKRPTAEAFSKLTSALDKAAKNGVLHRNKAARLKSRLSKLIKSPAVSPKKKVALRPSTSSVNTKRVRG